MSGETYSADLVERMARRLFMESHESRSGWTWPINGDWGRDRDMERAEKALDFVLGDWLTEHDREVAAKALEDAATDPSMRLRGHSGISIRRMNARAAAIREARS